MYVCTFVRLRSLAMRAGRRGKDRPVNFGFNVGWLLAIGASDWYLR